MCCMYRFVHPVLFFSSFFFFFFNDTATTEIYTLSLHDALPISFAGGILGVLMMVPLRRALIVKEHGVLPYPEGRSEEHTSELQSRSDLVCRLLLEKKKKKAIIPDTVHPHMHRLRLLVIVTRRRH